MLLRASAPGSLMLLGEYAVLHGKFALVCAVDKRMTVSFAPRNDQKILITSQLGHLETTLATLSIQSPFQFVLAALSAYKKHFKQGFELVIESEFSDQIGFASSAAVTVATLAVINRWCDFSFSPEDLILKARKIIRKVQGRGSGADVAACVLGGMIAYRAQPFSVEKLPATYPLTVLYSGAKTPTAQAIQYVNNKFLQHPLLLKHIYQGIGVCSVDGIAAARQQDWAGLGNIMNIQQGFMDALCVNTPILNELVCELRRSPAILGAKISGSGLGDCVVGLGSKDFSLPGSEILQLIPVTISSQGVLCEKI